MPLFEYRCSDCGHRFEAFVTAARAASCPLCQGQALEKQLSVFAVSTASRERAPEAGACGTCGDPRGPGACSVN